MKFIGDFTQDEKGLRVGFIHCIPFDEEHGLGKTEEELRQIGALVEDIPEPEQVEGKTPVMYYNPQTNSVYYEYIDRPLTPEEELRQRIELMQQALDALLLGGMQ
ncbi:hypothetical protein CS060_04175 [Anoxybacillus flavithermus]|uniref:Uncharacterized protein n=1 Tax=Anoxybacillus flavithermus TaxID=33934 RepID=A0A2G5RS44_9BACL|nr:MULTISPECIES: hypothetical protein [Anoxybacillus]PIC05481.1 hypothetical protein CS060_04175 [Anoxybacillus flavithermus]